MRLVLISLIVFAFFANYEICNLVYPNPIDNIKWWELKLNIIAFTLAIAFYLIQRDSDNKITKFVLLVGIGFAISNCIDRLFFNVNYFTFSDYFMIIITILTSYYKIYVRKRS